MPLGEYEIVAVMRTENRPLKARQIASILRTESGKEVSRQEVNRLLYDMKNRGVVNIDENYFWTLSGEARYGVLGRGT